MRSKFQTEDEENNFDNDSITFNSSNALNQDKVEMEYRKERFQKVFVDLEQLDWKDI